MQVCEGGLQQLVEAGSPWLSRVQLMLEIRGLLVPQLQFCKLHNQSLLPHRPLVGGPTLREGSKVRYGEAKDKSSVGRKEGEGGEYFSALCQGEKKTKNLSVFRKSLFSPYLQIHHIMVSLASACEQSYVNNQY